MNSKSKHVQLVFTLYLFIIVKVSAVVLNIFTYPVPYVSYDTIISVYFYIISAVIGSPRTQASMKMHSSKTKMDLDPSIRLRSFEHFAFSLTPYW